MARQDILLWSINERLAGKKGQDVPEPSLLWVDDVVDYLVKTAPEPDVIEDFLG